MNPIIIWSCVAGIATLAIVVFWARWSAGHGIQLPLQTEIGERGGDTLVVLAHGYRGTTKWMAVVRAVIEEARPDADVLLFQYPSHALTNADPFAIAEQMCERIQERHGQKNYKRIMLVGYSKGALLLRKAYVYGHGRIDDLIGQSGHGESRDKMDWVDVVERFVLLAGMNRGWTLLVRPAAMSVPRWLRLRCSDFFARLTGTASLMMACERGHPFVANLRIQWLELVRSLPAEKRPTVIQLLGDRDDLVSSRDQRDVTVAKDFIWVRVNNMNHSSITDLEDPVSGSERRQKIKEALGDAETVENLRWRSSKLPDNEDPLVEVVVVVLHGIRDMAAWTSQFEEPLQEAFQAKNPSSNSKLHVHRPSYDFFGMGPFLLWGDRQKNVRWFMDEFTEIIASFPNLREIHFIGHSNGTYLLASALEKYRTLRVGRIAFAGSVVPRTCDWKSITGRIEAVRNYVGSSDWVVGLFPRLFELSLFSFMNQDIGSAGFNGFTQAEGNSLETKYLKGAHDAALDKRNIDSIVEFIINGRKTDNPEIITQDRSTLMEYSSRLCWAVWLILIALVAVAGWLCLQFGYGISSNPATAAAALGIYVVVILLVLKNL